MDGIKVAALILFFLLILESSFLYYLFISGRENIDKENQCSVNVCGEGYVNGTYDAYQYQQGYCVCYKDGKSLLTRYLG